MASPPSGGMDRFGREEREKGREGGKRQLPLLTGSMSTDPSLYPRWERHGAVSQFWIGPAFACYERKELKPIGGSLFVASTHLLGKEGFGKRCIAGPTEPRFCAECRFMKTDTLEKVRDAL